MKHRNKLILCLLIFIFSFQYIVENTCFASNYKLEKFKSGLDENIPKLMEKYKIPGTSIVIVENGEKNIFNYGFSNKMGNIKVSDNTIFQVGSISKTISAFGVMKLVEQGKLDLDAPVENHLTRWHIPRSKYNKDNVTIRRLLSHTSGLSRESYLGYLPGKTMPTIEQSLNGINNGAEKIQLINNPGEKFIYSGGGYTLLQLIIEEVSRMPFDEFMKKEILNPINMNNSSFDEKTGLSNMMAKSYGYFTNEVPAYIYTEKAAAGFYTTPRDFANFIMEEIRSYDNKSTVLKSSMIQLMHKEVKDNYGLGHEVTQDNNGNIIISHGGTNRGWRAQYVLIPNKKCAIAIMTNSDNGQEIINDILNYWHEYKTGSLPKAYLRYRSLCRLICIVAMTISLICVAYFLKLIMDLKQKKRIFITNFNKKFCKHKIVQASLAVCFIVLWIITLYTTLIIPWTLACFLPYSLKYITYSLLILSMLLILKNVFPKNTTRC